MNEGCCLLCLPFTLNLPAATLPHLMAMADLSLGDPTVCAQVLRPESHQPEGGHQR